VPARQRWPCSGPVSKHRERGYRRHSGARSCASPESGASQNWIKIKNPQHPAMTRVMKVIA
jgi:hypothetical protein